MLCDGQFCMSGLKLTSMRRATGQSLTGGETAKSAISNDVDRHRLSLGRRFAAATVQCCDNESGSICPVKANYDESNFTSEEEKSREDPTKGWRVAGGWLKGRQPLCILVITEKVHRRVNGVQISFSSLPPKSEPPILKRFMPNSEHNRSQLPNFLICNDTNDGETQNP